MTNDRRVPVYEGEPWIDDRHIVARVRYNQRLDYLGRQQLDVRQDRNASWNNQTQERTIRPHPRITMAGRKTMPRLYLTTLHLTPS